MGERKAGTWVYNRTYSFLIAPKRIRNETCDWGNCLSQTVNEKEMKFQSSNIRLRTSQDLCMYNSFFVEGY